MRKEFQFRLLCSFASWLHVGFEKSISEHGGINKIELAWLEIDDPEGHHPWVSNA
jgi:hypothetical protein